MKVFAILTACLMTAGGATYYLSSSDGGCPFGGCPVATSGGCCSTGESAKLDCCTVSCPACETDCLECCAVCEECCVAGVQLSASVPVYAKVKTDCCVTAEACCEANSPAAIATAAVVAGVSLK